MPALLLRFLVVALLAYVAGSTITPLIYTQSVTAQAKETLSPLSGGRLPPRPIATPVRVPTPFLR